MDSPLYHGLGARPTLHFALLSHPRHFRQERFNQQYTGLRIFVGSTDVRALVQSYAYHCN